MRVLHWYPNFLGGGGVANAVLGLVQAQAELGAEVAIATTEPEGLSLYQEMVVPEQVKLLRWWARWSLRWGTLRLRKFDRADVRQMLTFNPEVVHIHGEFNPDNLWVPRILSGVPLVMTPHGAFHPIVLKKSKATLKRLYIALANRLLYRRVTLFHALCPAEAGHIQAALGSVNLYILPQGTNPHMSFTPGAPTVSSRTPGEVCFIFVGRLDIYTKGLDILLDAFSKAVQQTGHKDLHLTIVGPDWRGSLARLKEQVARLGLEGHVTFTGALPGNRVAEYLQASDVYIHLSRHEGLPLAVTEALCAGKPAILSREIGTVSYLEVASLPHVKVVDPNAELAASAILEVCEKLQDLRNEALRIQEKICQFFDWHQIAQRHLEHYARVTG